MPTLLGIPLNSMTAIIAKTVDIYFENLKLILKKNIKICQKNLCKYLFI